MSEWVRMRLLSYQIAVSYGQEVQNYGTLFLEMRSPIVQVNLTVCSII